MTNAAFKGFQMMAETMTKGSRFTVTPKDGRFEVKDNGKVAGIVGSIAAAEELISVLS